MSVPGLVDILVAIAAAIKHVANNVYSSVGVTSNALSTNPGGSVDNILDADPQHFAAFVFAANVANSCSSDTDCITNTLESSLGDMTVAPNLETFLRCAPGNPWTSAGLVHGCSINNNMLSCDPIAVIAHIPNVATGHFAVTSNISAPGCFAVTEANLSNFFASVMGGNIDHPSANATNIISNFGQNSFEYDIVADSCHYSSCTGDVCLEAVPCAPPA